MCPLLHIVEPEHQDIPVVLVEYQGQLAVLVEHQDIPVVLVEYQGQLAVLVEHQELSVVLTI